MNQRPSNREEVCRIEFVSCIVVETIKMGRQKSIPVRRFPTDQSINNHRLRTESYNRGKDEEKEIWHSEVLGRRVEMKPSKSLDFMLAKELAHDLEEPNFVEYDDEAENNHDDFDQSGDDFNEEFD